MNNLKTLDNLINHFFYEGEKKLSAQQKEFFMEDSYRKVIRTILAYIAKSPIYLEKGGSFRKGIFLGGPNGSGKTTIFKILRELGLRKVSLYFPMISCAEVVAKYNSEPFKENIIEYYSFGNFCFDDLGKEPIASNYGKEDIFIRILENRYREFTDKNTKTFITTNLTIDEIGKRYGVHIQDRFLEMFNIHELNIKSFR